MFAMNTDIFGGASMSFIEFNESNSSRAVAVLVHRILKRQSGVGGGDRC